MRDGPLAVNIASYSRRFGRDEAAGDSEYILQFRRLTRTRVSTQPAHSCFFGPASLRKVSQSWASSDSWVVPEGAFLNFSLGKRNQRTTGAFIEGLRPHGFGEFQSLRTASRLHKSLRVPPAIESGITDDIWEPSDLLGVNVLHLPVVEVATTEHTINDALAGVLRETRRAWHFSDVVRSENTGMLKDSSKRPDILVLEPNVSPVVIETEVSPAPTVESEAASRLGERVSTTGRTILSSIALRLPYRLRTKSGSHLKVELISATDFEMALYTGTSPLNATRWPMSGWLTGSAADLSILTQSASVPPDVIEQAADQLVSGVTDAAGLLQDIAQSNPGAIHKVSEELHQEDGEQTRRMAATILANAFVFQESLAGGPGDLATVGSLEELRSSSGLTKATILAEWRRILRVNYWPIFDIARRILEVIPTSSSKAVIERMADTADKLLQNRLMRSHDLTGAVFQRLIADRKFLAAFYTTPSSAALLASLVLAQDRPPANGSWSNADDVKTLRIADFACGTGTLVSTAYQRIGQLHELAGGDAEALHADMMANSLIGCDVLPAAAHLTASMLAGAHPTSKYMQSSILTVAWGKQPDDSVTLGSLDLLDPQRALGILNITARAAEGLGESEKETWTTLPHSSFDVVIMNPPFTRATVHEAERLKIPNPMFAAFRTTPEDQRLMSEATRRLTANTSAHGNAGEASIFLVLADRKLKPEGVLGLVMPLSLMLGHSWNASRRLLATNYSDLVLVSIAAPGTEEMSFSADTDIGECLVVGGRTAYTGIPVGEEVLRRASSRATFVILNNRPTSTLEGSTTAKQIRDLMAAHTVRQLEDGPMGGTALYVGEDVIGHAMEAPLPDSGGWNLARIADLSSGQAAYQLANERRVWLPTMNKSDAVDIPITTVGQIGRTGPIHRDINGRTPRGGIRGPFDIQHLRANSAPTYPVLWSHDADRERTMAFDGDSEAVPRGDRPKPNERLLPSKWRAYGQLLHILTSIAISDLIASPRECSSRRVKR